MKAPALLYRGGRGFFYFPWVRCCSKRPLVHLLWKGACAMKAAMKTLAVGAFVALLSVPFAYGQPRPELRDAGSKMRDEAVSGHEYLMYQRLARERAELTYHQYTRPAPVITPHEAKQAAAQIRKDLTASDRSEER